jgi:hypothetical protein
MNKIIFLCEELPKGDEISLDDTALGEAGWHEIDKTRSFCGIYSKE